MKKFLVTQDQLNEYIENKKAENVFYEIVESIHNNMKYLNENVSISNANKSVIADYRRKNLITPRVDEMLSKHNIINNNNEII